MPLALAIAFSALLHAVAIVLPEWQLPGNVEAEPATIEAHLAPPPKPAPPMPKPHPHEPRPRAPEMAPAAPIAQTAAPVAAPEPPPAAPEAPPAVEAPPPPPVPPWGSKGRVRYVVTWGDGGFVIGETVQEWRVEGNRYSIYSVAEPKGLAALRGRTRAQSSVGEVTADGLRPSEFHDRREGSTEEQATFDWPKGRVAFSGGRGDAALETGAQDLVSVFYQLAWQMPRQSVDVAVATASRIGRWTFERLGEEPLELPAGKVTALHLRARADGDTTEVWLAPVYGGLPVKIRYTDRKGDAFEQAADLTEFK